MKPLLFIVCALTLIISAMIWATGSVKDIESTGFPILLSKALENKAEIEFKNLAPEIKIVCIVPEYSTTARTLEEFGISDGPFEYVPELETVIVLQMSDESFEYKGYGSKYLYRFPYPVGCYRASDLRWSQDTSSEDFRYGIVSGQMLERAE